MSDILLVGLSGPEAGAIEILFARRWPSLRTDRLARGERLGIPEQSVQAKNCSSCLVDLASLGLRKRSEETETALMDFLAGRPAILLSRDLEGHWLERPLGHSVEQPIVVVQRPFSSADLLAAMAPLLVAVEQRKTPSAAAGTRKAALAANGTNVRATDLVRPSPRKIVRGIGLRKGALAVLLNVFPELRAQPLIALGERILTATEAVQMRLNKDVMFVACVQQGWLASGIRLPMLLKMLSTSPMLDQMAIQPLSNAEAEVVVRERFGDLQHRMRHPLDTLVWELAATRLEGVSLQPKGDLRLQLKRLPNFTRLNAVGPLDGQLAAICAREPRTLAELIQQFPASKQQVYRFAVLSLLSGIGEVMPDQSLAAMRTPAQDAQRRSFFKSLLDRLF